MSDDDQADRPDAPIPERLEVVSIDPLPYLKDLLRQLPASDRRSGPNAALRRDIERGLQDPAFGLRLLVDDPRFDGVLPERLITLEDMRQPTARERAQQNVLGQTVLIKERRRWRYRPAMKDGQLVARPLTKPATEDV